MKTNTTILFLFFLLVIVSNVFSQEAPIKDFRLPNDELVTIFIGKTDWRGPYIQSVDNVDGNFTFSNLNENASQSVFHGSESYYNTCGTSGKFKYDNGSLELLTGTIVHNRDYPDLILQHFVYGEDGLNQITNLVSLPTGTLQPCMVSGYFTPEAKQNNRKEVVISYEAGGKYSYVAMNGFIFSTAGNEVMNRFYLKKLFTKNSGYMSPIDLVTCDYDGDGYDEICYVYGSCWMPYYYNAEKINICSFDWTPEEDNVISFPFGAPEHKTIKKWEQTANSENLFRISAGDLNNDGKDEIVILKDFRYSSGHSGGFQIQVFEYSNETSEWTQMEFNNVGGFLLDNDKLFTNIEPRNDAYDNIQLDVADLDNNGCCDIAASLTYKTSNSESMHYWIYSFSLDAIDELVAKEELNSKISNTGLKHAMAITNMNSDEYSEIYFVTVTDDGPNSYAITYDTTNSSFKQIQQISTSTNNYDYASHGFTWPVIIPMDIDNDSYWCRYKKGMVDIQNKAPFIGKPVAIINPPPYQETINPGTKIEIKFKTAHDTLSSVQTQTGYAFDLEIEAESKLAGTKAVFEQHYRDTVKNNKSFYEGNSDNDYWECHKNATQVIFPTCSYDIYPYRIETFSGDAIKSQEDKDMFLYILKPSDAGTHLTMRIWDEYVNLFEESYGLEEKTRLVNFMSPFNQHSPGNIISFQNNSNPYFLNSNLQKAFPTLEQYISTAFTNYNKEWGLTDRADETCERSQRWDTIFDLKTDQNWGIVSGNAHLRLHYFTTTKEMIGSSNEDGILVKINFQGVGEPLTDDDNKSYIVKSYAFWGPKELGLNGAIIITHQVTEVGSYYDATDVEANNELPKEFSLSQNFPNPFNPTTKIKYQLPKAAEVSLKAFDVLGNEIANLVNKKQPAGFYEVEFDASELSSGIYFYRISAGDFVETKKMILIR